HQLMLRPLAAIEEDDGAVHGHGDRGDVARAGGDAGAGAEEGDAKVLHEWVDGCQLSVLGADNRQLTTDNKTKWPREPLPPGAVLNALAAAKGHPRQIFASVIHRITVTGSGALTSAMKRSRRLRCLSDSSPHCGPCSAR